MSQGMKERILLELLISKYSGNPAMGWVTMENIIIATRMSSFSQRIQEWRDCGIKVENRRNKGKSEYKLFTHPEDIDRKNFRCTAVQVGMDF